jgi:membrane fusion protein (multidrug efflux system)
VLLVAACSKSATPAAPPPPEVRIITVGTEPIANVIELPGRLQAVRISEVRARVDGIVERRVYTEGTDVREGRPCSRSTRASFARG